MSAVMSVWDLSLSQRRWLMVGGTIGLTVLAGGVFARGFFVGPADWVVAVGGGLLLALCLFGHFSWLLGMIGFVGRRSRPVEEPAIEDVRSSAPTCRSGELAFAADLRRDRTELQPRCGANDGAQEECGERQFAATGPKGDEEWITTPFAQAMQFSISRLGAIFSCGFSWFLGPEALSWGHTRSSASGPSWRTPSCRSFPANRRWADVC